MSNYFIGGHCILKNMKYKVTIITPCFNSEKTIRDTIESVLHQTYGNIEYIIVDGGSKDSTVDIIKEYEPLFQGRLKYISEKDAGVYDAMNKGLRMSCGSLIGIINSDDYYELDAVENAVSNMTKEKYQVIYGYCTLYRRNNLVDILKGSHKTLNVGMIPHPTCFVTRAVYCDLGMFSYRYKIASDYELMLRFQKSGKVQFIQIPKVLANFRYGGLSTNSKMNKRLNLEMALIRYQYRTILIKELLLELYFYIIL